MECYINAKSDINSLSLDIKELVPEANIRRRMSAILKQGVSVGMDCIIKNGKSEDIDAIITSTALGCLEDSEKFLKNIIENDEELLNPTPFIQSTFNTIGAQIALLCKNHSYNMTYCHRNDSFKSALLDAMMLLENNQAKNVLVGNIEINTPTKLKIMDRLRLDVNDIFKEDLTFYVLSKDEKSRTLGKIKMINLLKFEIEWF